MRTTLPRSLVLIALAVFASHGRAEDPRDAATTRATQPAQGFIVALPQAGNAASGNAAADEPQRLPPTEVRASRDDSGSCESRQGTAQEACRARLAAKYAEMDRLCRIVSGTEIPVCIKSAYAAD